MYEPDRVFQFWQGYDEARSSLCLIKECKQCLAESWLTIFDQHIKGHEQLSPYSQGQEAAHLDVLFFCKKHACGKDPVKIDPQRRVHLWPSLT